MPRVAIQLTPDLLAGVCALMNVVSNPLSDYAYLVVEAITPTEFNLKLMSEDEIFAAAAVDSDLHITQL